MSELGEEVMLLMKGALSVWHGIKATDDDLEKLSKSLSRRIELICDRYKKCTIPIGHRAVVIIQNDDLTFKMDFHPWIVPLLLEDM